MRRVVAVLVAAAAMVTGLATGTAGADVHGVSQADCAPDGVPSGAIASRPAIEHGRPAALIPVTASGGKTQGKGGEAPAQGTNC
jgi:hypothetical protein